MSTTDRFPTDTEGLQEATPSETVELADGQEFDLRIAPVVKQLGDSRVRMLAYNGSIPGPTLKVKEGSEIVVHAENQGDRGGDGPLARPSAREPVRRHPSNAAADGRRRELHRSRELP